jgi:DNA/RNA-binding domain of Phe-tRNA-synthetase-like protein
MAKQITIAIDKEIFSIAPGYRRVVVVAQGFKNRPSSPELRHMLEQETQGVREHVVIEDSRLVAWREAFHSVGIKPNKFRPSVDALVRRVLNGGALPSISTAVDIGTILSLRHMLPCGAHSLHDVKNELVLRFATGTEQFVPFGTDTVETVTQREVIFTDGDLVATSKWAWRQANHTIMRPSTTTLELNIDALQVINDAALAGVVRDAQELITTFLGAATTAYTLAEAHPSVNISVNEK